MPRIEKIISDLPSEVQVQYNEVESQLRIVISVGEIDGKPAEAWGTLPYAGAVAFRDQVIAAVCALEAARQ